MPSTATITSTDLYSFVARQKIKSAEWNSTIAVFRGHLLPVNTDTSSSSDISHDLGTWDHSWRRVHTQETAFRGLTATGSNPTTGAYKLYFKTDGNLYKLNSSGTETQVDAAVASPTIVSTSGGFSIGTQDIVILNPSAAALTCTLPSAVTATKKLIVKNSVLNAGFNAITLDGSGSETIDDTLTTSLNTGGEVLTLAPDGTNWQIIDRRIPSEWKSFTPIVTATGSAVAVGNGTWTGSWKRDGDTMHVRVTTLFGSTSSFGSGDVLFGLPNSITADSTKINSTINHGHAWIHDNTSATLRKSGRVSSYTSNYSFVRCNPDDINSDVTQTSPMTWTTSDYISLDFKLPITGWKG